MQSIGDAQCSDDWCITVESVKRPPATGPEIYYDVNFRISSSAHRVVQREKGLVTYLIDGPQTFAAMVDANMEQESSKLSALQTQQQLAVQSLSIANSSSQSILSLFK